MANYLVFLAIPDHHIEFLKENPVTLNAYLLGEQQVDEPDEQHDVDLPSDWPKEEPRQFGMEVNHRNVDLYHALLNGSLMPVSHSGCVFQTWLSPEHTAMDLTGYGEDFAFKSQQVPELLDLVRIVTKDQIRQRFAAWLEDQGKDGSAADDCGYLYDEFKVFAQDLQTVVDKKLGLIWISA